MMHSVARRQCPAIETESHWQHQFFRVFHHQLQARQRCQQACRRAAGRAGHVNAHAVQFQLAQLWRRRRCDGRQAGLCERLIVAERWAMPMTSRPTSVSSQVSAVSRCSASQAGYCQSTDSSISRRPAGRSESALLQANNVGVQRQHQACELAQVRQRRQQHACCCVAVQ